MLGAWVRFRPIAHSLSLPTLSGVDALLESRLVPMQVQIVAVEVAYLCELAPIANVDRPRAGTLDQSVTFEASDGAIHMDRSQPGCVPKLLLGYRQFIARLGTHPSDLQA